MLCIAPRALTVELLLPLHHVASAAVSLDELADVIAALAGALCAFDAQHVELAVDVTENEIGPGHLALPVHAARPTLSRKKNFVPSVVSDISRQSEKGQFAVMDFTSRGCEIDVTLIIYSGPHSLGGSTLKLLRRNFLYLAAGAAALPTVSRLAKAEAYPARPVRIIVTFAAGSASDVNSRLIGQVLSERLGQPFIVENRPGAGGSLGAGEAIRSRPDGYTMFFMSTSHTINASFYDDLPFNIVDDTTPIAFLFSTNDVMVVNPSLPVKSVPEFIAYAKANPGRINMASQGVGSIGHLAGELFKSMTGINMVHIPYRSVALALADVISGQMHVQFATSTDSVPQIRGGQVRALAVSSKTRSPALPNVPTMAEYLPDYAYESWGGFAGPKKSPPEIVEVLNSEVNAALVQPHIKAKYDDLGLRANATSPAEFGKIIAEETLKWAKVIKFAGIKPE
jgi:tripartite-type tricarboxylate transporter receptor subunit TctC